MLDRDLVKAVSVTAQLTATHLTEPALETMVLRLGTFRRDAVLKSLERCQLEVRPGQLSLAAIMDRLDDGHLGPESAWALVGTLTEDDSVVWTDEIAQAYGAVRDLLAEDRIGARMAFLDNYRKRLGDARRMSKPPIWMASLGSSHSGRVAALKAAVEQNKLGASQAKAMLPRHDWPREWDPARALPEARPDKEQVRAMIDAVLEKKLITNDCEGSNAPEAKA